MKNIIFSAIIVIASFILQNTICRYISFGNIVPNLLLITVSSFGFIKGKKAGVLTGFFAGLLWDLTSGVHMGFNCIYIALMCFFSCALVSYIARDIFITNIVSISVATVLYGFLYWLFFIIIKGVSKGEMTLITFYIPCVIYTLVLSPLIYIILKPLKRKLNQEPKPII